MLKRKTPLPPRKGRLPRGRGPKKVGKKAREWMAVRRELKSEFAAMGVNVCEIGGPGCRRDNFLSFMHRFKRRFITTEQELRTVCLACTVCHDSYELAGHREMKEAVDAAIERRQVWLEAREIAA